MIRIYDFVSSKILIILPAIMLILIAISIFVKMYFCFDVGFIVTGGMTALVPFVLIGYNKLKDQNSDVNFRNIVNTSIFNCLSKMQNVYNNYLEDAYKNNIITLDEKESEKFKNTKYDRSNNLSFKYKIIEIKNYTDNEIKSIENSKLHFQNYENFILFIKYKEIIDKYNSNKLESSTNGNRFYKELYDILEINKDKIKEMII